MCFVDVLFCKDEMNKTEEAAEGLLQLETLREETIHFTECCSLFPR